MLAKLEAHSTPASRRSRVDADARGARRRPAVLPAHRQADDLRLQRREDELRDRRRAIRYVVKVQRVRADAPRRARRCVISAQIESDSSTCARGGDASSSKELGVAESGVGALIRATYHLLGLRTYFTAGEKEVRAWTIHAGDTAPKAAGVIHTDFERGFIKAETVA